MAMLTRATRSRARARWVEAINAAGGSAKYPEYPEYPGVDHNGTLTKAWTEEQELLPFIYSQRRKP
jgi:hypothetical protein